MLSLNEHLHPTKNSYEKRFGLLPNILRVQFLVHTVNDRGEPQLLYTLPHQAFVSDRKCANQSTVLKVASSDVSEAAISNFGPRWFESTDGANGISII